MSDRNSATDLLAGALVDDAVFELRPDYRALLVAVEGITPGPTDEHSDALLRRAEAVAAVLLADSPVEDLPHVAAWREAYRAFGAKPQRNRNSLEALNRRAAAGLPRVNRLTDLYNAISVLHQLPIGGEDLDRYAGSVWCGPLAASGSTPWPTGRPSSSTRTPEKSSGATRVA
jgi:DNA/RNA-binding domain of Phe-tRNA-synthetase-like protein